MNLILSKLRCKIGQEPSCAASEPCMWPPLPLGGAIASRVPDGQNPPGLLLCGATLPPVPNTENGWPIRRLSNSPKNNARAVMKYFCFKEKKT